MMNRNTEAHFNLAPSTDIQRSRFDMSFNHKTTFDAGELIPIGALECLPSDTFKINLSAVVRMATPIKPVMDNAYMDIYAFFVPERLTWEHFREFMGENRTDAWTPEVTYTKPKLTAPSGGWKRGTIADYMGIPTMVDNFEIDATYFRGYALIWNEWFRSEPLKDPAHIYMDETTRAGKNGDEVGETYITSAEFGGKPLKVAKLHDYFTSALPGMQYGNAVQLPLGNTAPLIFTETQPHSSIEQSNLIGKQLGNIYRGYQSQNYPFAAEATDGSALLQNSSINLATDLSEATAATINQLRQAFAIQRWEEAMARGGNRYREIVRNMFGAISPDGRQQVPEYLGGFRMPINMTTVLQTSATDSVTPQGNEAGYSVTVTKPGGNSIVHYSCTEHGRLFILGCIRTDRTYQQGLNRKFTRFDKFEYYWKQFAHLSEQAILNQEIYLQGTAEDKEAFGFQERYAEYRMEPNRVSGDFRSNSIAGTLDSWHYADDYAALPRLGAEWIDEPKENIDRTIAVTSEISHQFIADFWADVKAFRPMPVFSIPGLLDHY